MWIKFCLTSAICVAVTLFPLTSAKALLVDGSYMIELMGPEIDPSTGTFQIFGGTVQNFSLDLLQGGEPANEDSQYSVGSTLLTEAAGSMFSGTIFNPVFFGIDNDNDSLIFFNNSTWMCAFSDGDLCETSNGALDAGDGGTYSIAQVSPVPIPAALPLLLGALAVLGMVGWRGKRRAAT